MILVGKCVSSQMMRSFFLPSRILYFNNRLVVKPPTNPHKKNQSRLSRAENSHELSPNLLLIDVTAFSDSAPIIQILLGTLTLHQRDL